MHRKEFKELPKELRDIEHRNKCNKKLHRLERIDRMGRYSLSPSIGDSKRPNKFELQEYCSGKDILA